MVYIRSRAHRAFFDALRKYQKAYRRFSKAQPTLDEAETAFDAALDELLETLKIQEVRDALSACLNSMEEVDDGHQRVVQELLGDSNDARAERALASNFGMSKQAVKRIARFFSSAKSSGKNLSHQSILEIFRCVHADAKSQINKSRELPRKEKKSRKRDVRRGVYSVTFGSGILVANTVAGPSFLFSYGIACIAIHQAGRDFIGDL